MNETETAWCEGVSLEVNYRYVGETEKLAKILFGMTACGIDSKASAAFALRQAASLVPHLRKTAEKWSRSQRSRPLPKK